MLALLVQETKLVTKCTHKEITTLYSNALLKLGGLVAKPPNGIMALHKFCIIIIIIIISLRAKVVLVVKTFEFHPRRC